jgi:hypothetical protein
MRVFHPYDFDEVYGEQGLRGKSREICGDLMGLCPSSRAHSTEPAQKRGPLASLGNASYSRLISSLSSTGFG